MMNKLLYRRFVSTLQNNIRQKSTSTPPPSTRFVFGEEIDDKGVLILNRPKALNALNYDMLNDLIVYLNKWNDNKTLILIKSNVNKAFCSGVDLKSIVESNTPDMGKQLLGIDYVVMYLIGRLNIPYVALTDGITMGSGAGLAVNGRYRIATEKTIFAMPETNIGANDSIK